MIDTVLFDFVNTIAFLEPRREDILCDYVESRTGTKLNKSQVLAGFIRVDERMPYSSVKIRNFQEKKDFYNNYNDELFRELNLEESSGFCDYYYSVKKGWVLDSQIVDLFRFLKSKEMRIGIVSNFDDNLEEILKRLEIRNMIDFVAVSQEIGLEKPDIKFYKYVQKGYNIDLDTTIYVGDSYNLDYVPSQKAGYKSVLIDRTNYYSSEQDKISCLKDIKKIINAS